MSKTKPNISFLHVCFRYEDGRLFWKQRPLAHFASLRAYHRNTKRLKNNTSGFKCVFLKGLKWYAHIKINNVQTHIGVFDTPEAAHAAYCIAAKEHFGEFFNPG